MVPNVLEPVSEKREPWSLPGSRDFALLSGRLIFAHHSLYEAQLLMRPVRPHMDRDIFYSVVGLQVGLGKAAQRNW